MIYVIKRSGKQQPFDPAKIQTSVLNAAKDAGVQMTFKEARLMSDDGERQLIALNGKVGLTSSFEVRSLVRAALREFGYVNVAEMFERGRTEDYSDIKRHLEAIQMHTDALDRLAKAERNEHENEQDLDKTQLYRSRDDD